MREVVRPKEADAGERRLEGRRPFAPPHLVLVDELDLLRRQPASEVPAELLEDVSEGAERANADNSV